ncbi:MAG: hypothetical protein CMH52_05555 [Myxococcales bacterium]|nr:hypothetical protein [Myxococcales bacterium]
MVKYIIFFLVSLWIGQSQAGVPEHWVSIVSPNAGECVNNGPETFTGGIIGGEAQAPARDVPLVFQAYSVDGEPLTLTFLTEWTEIAPNGQAVDRNEMYQIVLSVPADEILETDGYPIPGFFVNDGDDVRLTIRAEHPTFGPTDSDVVFDLDRKAPVVVMNPDSIANAQSECADDPADFNYQVSDERTPEEEIISAIRVERDGCIVRRVINVRDNCGNGNAQELELISEAPADAASIDLEILGFRCTIDGCVTEGDGAIQFEDGARVSMPTFVPVINAPNGCASSVEAVVMRADEQVDSCPESPPVLTGAPGNECAGDAACAGAQTCNNGYCAEPAQCQDNADCRGERVCKADGCVSPCSPLEGGRVFEDAGDYVARLRVSSCDGNAVETSMTVTVLEKPIAVAGGNLENGDYEVRQGEQLVLDGSTSFAAPEVGGIVQYAWDLNGDGFYNVDNEIFAGDQPTVEFDTLTSGQFRRRLRVTAGNGTSAYVWFNITVLDVDPICDAGGPYEIFEGEALELDGSLSAAGHETDPIRSYAWDFGDGFRPQTGATLRRPLHIYRDASNGPLTVTLTVSDPDSQSQCTADVIVNDVQPQLDGVTVLNPQAATEGELMRFEANAQPGSQSDPLTYFAWTFGLPGAGSEGEARRTAEYTYMDNGTYQVCVTVQDEDSNVSDCTELEIADLEPFASMNGPDRAIQGEELTFDASNTQAGGLADPLTMLVWNWGDGSNLETVQLGNNVPNQFLGTHTYAEDGVYTVTLRVVDEDSAAIVTQVVTVEDAQPEAQFEINYPGLERTIAEGVDLLFNAAGSRAGSVTDPIEEFVWDFGDGTTRTLERNQPGVTHKWADEGAYEVRLTVIDDDGSESSLMRIVEVTNRAPTVQLQADSNQVDIGENVLFVALSGDAPADDGARIVALIDDVEGDLPPALVRWEMGDGSVIEAGSHRYAFNSLGQKTVRVTVDDGDGGSTDAEIVLNVTPAAPSIEAIDPQTVREGELLTFDVLVNAPVIGPGQYDQIDVTTVESPPGAEVEYIQEESDIRVRFTWQPTFYDAGYHRLWLRANSSEAERLRIIDINVDDAGVPRLVALSGSPSRGVINFYDYERGLRSVVLRSNAEIELGLGVGSLCASPDGRYVWATVPGSNKVAVVSTAGAGELVRRIPVGGMPSAAVYGDNHIWVTNRLDSSLSVINAASMKVVTTFALDGLNEPSDLAWLPGGDGNAAQLLVVSASGHMAVIDPEQVLIGGLNPIVSTRQVGGILDRIVIDVDHDAVFISDSKTRRVYRLAASSVTDEDANVEGIPLAFAARDLHASDGRLWAATEMSLVEWSDGNTASNDLIRARALTQVIEQAVPGGALGVATGNRVENYSSDDMSRITDAAGNNIRRILTLVAPR